MQMPRIEFLQGMAIFGALRAESLELLLAHAGVREVAAGACFFREGDEARSMFVLEAGRVAVLRRHGGRELLLHTLATGDCFGEMALMDLQPRSATVRAETTCRALEFGTDALHALYGQDIEQFALIQMNLGREICRRLRAADDQLLAARFEGDA